MSTGKIYKITNLITNKIYIGKTIKELNVRFQEHINTAKRWDADDVNNKPHPYQSRLYPSMNKYGYDNFKIELIEVLPENSDFSVEQREQYWIAYYDSTNDNIGYNISPGGLGGPLFAGHKQSDYVKQLASQRFKGIPQTQEFITKRTRARARLMQSLDTGEIISILDLPKGYFYKQDFCDYRIYKSDSKFYACLEQPHNRKMELSDDERLKLLTQLVSSVKDRHNKQMEALHAGHKNMSEEAKKNMGIKVSNTLSIKRKAEFDKFILEHNIDIEQYKKDYLKFKKECPNRHLELIYKIPYSKVRSLNAYLGLFGGGSGHTNGKVTIETNN